MENLQWLKVCDPTWQPGQRAPDSWPWEKVREESKDDGCGAPSVGKNAHHWQSTALSRRHHHFWVDENYATWCCAACYFDDRWPMCVCARMTCVFQISKYALLNYQSDHNGPWKRQTNIPGFFNILERTQTRKKNKLSKKLKDFSCQNSTNQSYW